MKVALEIVIQNLLYIKKSKHKYIKLLFFSPCNTDKNSLAMIIPEP